MPAESDLSIQRFDLLLEIESTADVDEFMMQHLGTTPVFPSLSAS